MAEESRHYRISELERLSGVPRYTIHQYVRQGLLPEPVKTGKTMAYYNDDHLRRLQDITAIKGGSRLPVSYLKKALEGQGPSRVKRGPKEGPGAVDERSAQRVENRKRQIREAASRVFLEKGYPKARIKDITEAAGVSTGTFYIYYRDKKEVFVDVIDDLIRNMVGPAEEAFRKGGDLLRKATRIGRSYMENYQYFSGIINQLRGMMAEAEPVARDKFISLHYQLADPIARGVRQAIEEGFIREVDPELLAHAIMGIVEFLSIHLYFKKDHTPDQAVSFMTDLLMNGLRKPNE